MEELLPELDGALVLDVRSPLAFEVEAIPGARSVPLTSLAQSIEELAPDTAVPVVVYCNTGIDSMTAKRMLEHLGYTDVTNLDGGIEHWRAAGGPTTAAGALTSEERTRYSRHLRLPEVGEAGQAALLNASVAVVGAGGLGSSAALYLAAAGVGRMRLIDFDSVELSNLQRQILHGTSRVGESKVESAATTITDLNPGVRLDLHDTRLEASNVLELLGNQDVIVDGSDAFPTRYLVNDAAIHLGTPVVHGSILRFDGQATVFQPHQGPCYRCLFPLPPPPELAPSCEDAGVLGAMAGVIGSIQAMEAIKLITDIGTSLRGRLLRYGAFDGQFSTYSFDRDSQCAACSGELPTLVDYDEACTPVTR